MTEIIAKLEPSLGRRWVGVVALTVAGVALIAIPILFGAPFFITDTDERFWGQDRLDDLDAHLAGNL